MLDWGRSSVDPLNPVTAMTGFQGMDIWSERRLCEEVRLNLALSRLPGWEALEGVQGSLHAQQARTTELTSHARRTRTGWVERGWAGLALPRDQPANAELLLAMRGHPTVAPCWQSCLRALLCVQARPWETVAVTLSTCFSSSWASAIPTDTRLPRIAGDPGHQTSQGRQ
jgi:hypothetical protein